MCRLDGKRVFPAYIGSNWSVCSLHVVSHCHEKMLLQHWNTLLVIRSIEIMAKSSFWSYNRGALIYLSCQLNLCDKKKSTKRLNRLSLSDFLSALCDLWFPACSQWSVRMLFTFLFCFEVILSPVPTKLGTYKKVCNSWSNFLTKVNYFYCIFCAPYYYKMRTMSGWHLCVPLEISNVDLVVLL